MRMNESGKLASMPNMEALANGTHEVGDDQNALCVGLVVES